MPQLLALAAALGSLHQNAVRVDVFLEDVLEGHAVVRAVFTPDPQADPLHLYGLEVPSGSAGRATRLEAAGTLRPAGPPSADRETHLFEGLPVFPPGPVTVRLPVALPRTPGGGPVSTAVLVSYLACTENGCLLPVDRAPIALVVPSTIGPQTPELALPRDAPAPTIATGPHGFALPANLAELHALLDDAARREAPVLLDFTGPSCVNCQQMEKTVLRVPAVRAALARLVAVSVDTDPPHTDLAELQQASFQTQSRPLYVRIAPDGGQLRWSDVFSPDDGQRLDAFLAFLAGTGAGADAPPAGAGLEFWWLAILGGLVTLAMPCTYPMIPFTVSFFARQAETGRRVWPLAAAYSLGIVGCFTGFGVLVTGALGVKLSTLSGHPITNLLIALIFVALGLSLLGVFALRVPFLGGVGGARSGIAGAALMGLTFAVTAFACTAPFAGSVLAQAVTTGTWRAAVGGMTVYSSAIAVPFFALAMSPSFLRRLPRGGAWMNELKIVGGIVEVAAALKFLAICDNAWGWGVFRRRSTLAVWTAAAVLVCGYLLGAWRTPSDEPVIVRRPARWLLAASFACLAIWLAFGVAGHDVGVLESFFPADEAGV